MISFEEFQRNCCEIASKCPLWNQESDVITYKEEIQFDKDRTWTGQEPAILCIFVQYCKHYGVPTIYFDISRSDGQSYPLDFIWKEIFGSNDFVGKVSFEQLMIQDGRSRRMLRLHPCTTFNVLEGLSNSKNKTASLLNILLEKFILLDQNVSICLPV